MVVTDILVEHFPDVVDVSFTAKMEEELDDIAEGKRRVGPGAARVLRAVRRAAREEPTDEIERPQEELDELCPLCIRRDGRRPSS